MGLSVSDFTIDNASGQAVRLDIQACFKALQGQNAEGADSDMASSQCVAGMTFLNTTTDILKVRTFFINLGVNILIYLKGINF